MTKKIVSMFLAVLLIFGAVSTTAFAEDAEPKSKVNWDEFYVIAPKEEHIKIDGSDTITLTAEVNIPEGVEVTYQWYLVPRVGNKIRAFTESTAVFSKDNYFPEKRAYGGAEGSYYCEITGVERDENGEVISSKKIRTETICVIVKMTTFEKIAIFFRMPIVNGVSTSLAMIAMSGGLLIPFTPICFAVGMVASIRLCFDYIKTY